MNDRTRTLALAVVVVIGMTCAALLVRRIDTLRPPEDPNAIDESLYVNGKTARRISLGFNGLAADWYWMRSLQYVGRKIINDNDVIDDLGRLNLKLLAPLLDTATTLDPEFLDPYEYAAIVLPAINVNDAIRITQKGIDANPNAWRLYHHLGYIYWQQGNYQAAGEIYGRGAQISGAPPWMEAMKAKMAADGGSRSTAREIYTRMFEQSADEKVRDMARRRLLQLDWLDHRDALRKLFVAYRARAGKCPSSWKEIEPVFRALRLPTDASGAPLDPSGTPYVLRAGECEIDLDPKSEIPVK
ncbi:MAG TPA: tetratricopeptide repeat protein [Pyrinomonadaceae bacterium]|nr:tetratricopeptide repeat protein [Pyrinomonadaceae bacterium]